MEGPIYASEKVFHKGCFKCMLRENNFTRSNEILFVLGSQKGCTVSLTIKNYRTAEGNVYCVKHAPNLKPNVSTDSLLVTGALRKQKNILSKKNIFTILFIF